MIEIHIELFKVLLFYDVEGSIFYENKKSVYSKYKKMYKSIDKHFGRMYYIRVNIQKNVY